MKFVDGPLPGLVLVSREPHVDQRGSFERTWCAREFGDHGLVSYLSQCSVSYNRRRGTIRGLHYQIQPAAETKLVSCGQGAVYDVVVDLRPSSPTRYRHFAVELSAGNGLALYIPEGFAHGFQTLTNDTNVYYQIAGFHSPDHARGVRWDDPAFGIPWPIPHPILSARDAGYSLVDDALQDRGQRP